jgi:hypothetical protein
MYCVAAHVLVGLVIPPYDAQVVRRPGDIEQSSEGDWTVDLKAPEVPNLTVELQTSDLKELSSAGLINPMTVELSTLDIEEINPGKTIAEVGRIVGESSSVIVDLSDPEPPAPTGPVAPTNNAKPSGELSALLPHAEPAPTTRTARAQSPSIAPQRNTPRSTAIPTPQAVRAQTAPETDEPRGAWVVVVVYLLAIAALGASIYVRFFT